MGSGGTQTLCSPGELGAGVVVSWHSGKRQQDPQIGKVLFEVVMNQCAGINRCCAHTLVYGCRTHAQATAWVLYGQASRAISTG